MLAFLTLVLAQALPASQPALPAAGSNAGLSADDVKWLVGGIAGATVGAWLGGYFQARAEGKVRRQEFAAVLDEARRTTAAVKEIEERLAQQSFVGQTELAYRERQLAEFYGPIYGAAKSTGKLWRLYMDGKLGPIAAEVTDFFRRQNEEVIQVLKTKAHLVDGPEMPPSFSAYLTSVMIYNIGTRVGNGMTPEPVARLPEAEFPEEFLRHIVSETERLKRRLDQLYTAYRIATPDEPKSAAPAGGGQAKGDIHI
jgi:hypothetical protein